MNQVYETRTELSPLCKDVIRKLYSYADEFDAALLTKKEVEKMRNQATKEHKGTPPRNIELLKAYKAMIKDGEIEPNEIILGHIIKRKVRTLSGIANITVLMKSYGCPGKCIFCPTQPGMPKSYFSTQPAMLRAVRNEFDAYKQVKTRLNGLQSQGHDISKIDIRTAGGTWSSYPVDYQEYFVKSIYFALNEGAGEFLSDEEAHAKISAAKLEDLIKENETTESRCVGFWIETRPDWVTEEELIRLRSYGTTGIELGIQSTDDEVNIFNDRGHGIKESMAASNLARSVGLKVCHHIMPNLPKSTLESDLQSIHDLFALEGLKPDYIKIYPCVVLPYTRLQKMCEEDPSIYKPYTNEELIKLLTEIKKTVPEYCRIIRILRDFPSDLVLQGTKTLNIRQIMQNQGVKCRCVRCREIKGEKFDEKDIELQVLPYLVTEGEENFINFTDVKQDKLIGLLRLFLPKERKKHFIKELTGAAIVRELHVYGQQKTLSKNKETLGSNTQHLGYGKRLMQKAEEIAAEAGFFKIAVISAIGTREYYKKLGYDLEGTYMVKNLQK